MVTLGYHRLGQGWPRSRLREPYPPRRRGSVDWLRPPVWPPGPFRFHRGLVEPVAFANGESDAIGFRRGLVEPVTFVAGEAEV